MLHNKKDLTGNRYGKLLVLEETNERKDGGSIIWKCKCDCENICYVSSKRLRDNLSRSCGCYQNERQKYSMQKLHNKQFKENTNIDLIKRVCANSNSKSGVRGVSWSAYHKKWCANLILNKQVKLHKYFDELDDAIGARKEAEEQYFKPILDKYKEQN